MTARQLVYYYCTVFFTTAAHLGGVALALGNGDNPARRVRLEGEPALLGLLTRVRDRVLVHLRGDETITG